MGSLGGETAQSSQSIVRGRFRLHDGTDVGPVDLSLGSTVAEVKSAALAAWPTVRWRQLWGHTVWALSWWHSQPAACLSSSGACSQTA